MTSQTWPRGLVKIWSVRSAVGGVSLSLCAAAGQAQQLSAARLLAVSDSLANAAMTGAPIAGMAVGIARGPQLLLAKGYGLANLEHQIPVTPTTVFRLGSITKQFTAVAIMRLAEEGKLSVDDELKKYISGYPTHGYRITLHHLLTHTSGIRDFTTLYGERRRLDLTDEQVLGIFRSEEMDFAPGTRYKYNNSSYYMLGMIIEKLTGRSFGDYLDSAFFKPLGMTQTSYCRNDPIIPHRSQGYAIKDKKLVNAEIISMNVPGAAGGLCSTVGDLITWTRALHGGKVLSKESYQKLLTPATLNDGTPTTSAYGLEVGTRDGPRSIEHDGGISGFASSLAYYPESDLTIVVLQNTRAHPTIRSNIARAIFRLPLVAVTPRPPS